MVKSELCLFFPHNYYFAQRVVFCLSTSIEYSRHCFGEAVKATHHIVLTASASSLSGSIFGVHLLSGKFNAERLSVR